MKWLIPFLFILVGCNSVEPDLGELNGVTQVDERPFITSLNLPLDGTYGTSNPMTFSVTFSRSVTVFGNPRIMVITPTGTYPAFSSVPPGNQVSSMSFSYTPSAGHNDADGIQYSSNVVLGFGGSIYDPSSNLDANLQLPVADTSGITISTGTGPIPTVSGTYGGAGNALFGIGQTIELTLDFSESVTATDGTPSLTLNIGGTTKTATFVAGSNGSTSLRFRYVVEEGVQGSNITAAIVMPGTFRDSDGNIVVMNVDPNTLVDVDGIRPYIASVTNVASGAYKLGGTSLATTVTWNEAVYVANPAVLGINFEIDNGWKSFSVSGFTNGTSTMNFSYSVAAADTDFDGITNHEQYVEDGGTIVTDLAGNAAAGGSYDLPVNFNLTKVLISPPNMLHWFKLNNNTPGSSVQPNLSQFLNIVGNNHGSVSNSVNVLWNGVMATIPQTENVTLQLAFSPRFMVLMVDSTQIGTMLKSTTNTSYITLGAGGSVTGNNCVNTCRFLDQLSVWDTDSGGSMGTWIGSSGTKRLVVVDFNGTIANRQLVFFQTKLYEVMFFNSSATESQISDYVDIIRNKHGI